MIEYYAGVDIGNSTTEIALGAIEDDVICDCVSSITETTGLKGTSKNIKGIIKCLEDASNKMGISPKNISKILLNEATPVIGAFAMETIAETVITESTLIGHNPDTPGGLGLGIGETINFNDLLSMKKEKPYIIIVPRTFDFTEVAIEVNERIGNFYDIQGLVVENDDGVLISNRINKQIPIVDEVKLIDKVPLGMPCIVEVAPKGRSVEYISNPYGIATAFKLSPTETKQVVQIAKALMGSKSGVVIKTPKGDVKQRTIPAGKITLFGEDRFLIEDVSSGAEKIMKAAQKLGSIKDVEGESGTNVGGMIDNVKSTMANVTSEDKSEISIQDILAVDTLSKNEVTGSLANEYTMSNAVGISAMVKTKHMNMKDIAKCLSEEIGVEVEIGGVEGVMAVKGALTTPGTDKPIVVVDIGAGSTDSSILTSTNQKKTVHLAGAGDMVSALISSEAKVESREQAEDIKKNPLAFVESINYIRHEDGSIQVFDDPLSPELYARTVVVKNDELVPIDTKENINTLVSIRKSIKKKVIVQNVLRALRSISDTGELFEFEHVVLVGGTSLDFEICNFITDELSKYGVTSGRGNIRGREGPRNAVATGLLYSYVNNTLGVNIDE